MNQEFHAFDCSVLNQNILDCCDKKKKCCKKYKKKGKFCGSCPNK